MESLAKYRNIGLEQNRNFSQKIEILVENRNTDDKSKFWSKIYLIKKNNIKNI